MFEFMSDRKNLDFPESENSHELRHFWRRTNSGVEEEQTFSTYENVSICNDYHVSDIFRIGGKILQVG